MSKRFLDNVYDGENTVWHYIIVIGVVVLYWLLFAYLSMVVTQSLLESMGFHALIARMVSEAVPFAAVIGWLMLMLPELHERSWQSLINAESTINYRRVAQGFAVWGLQISIFAGLAIADNPSHYSFNFDWQEWSLLLILSVCLVPIQTSAEELLFRGYLMQGLRLLTKHPLWLMSLTGLAFAIPHFGNPEMARGDFIWGALDYFTWGVIFAMVTLKDNGLELALGMHAANNLFVYLFVTTPDSAVSSPALFVYEQPIDPSFGFLGLLIEGAIFYAVFFGGIPRYKLGQRSESSS
ncbi:MAG: lysostaphin resistance A-like protein [Phormidesmis sp.]